MQTNPSSLADKPIKSVDYLFISRHVDFLMLGGLSLVVWGIFFFFESRVPLVDKIGLEMPAVAYGLAFMINYPHFMASYKLAYTQSTNFVRQNTFQLIFVPVGLIVSFAVCVVWWNAPVPSSVVIDVLNGLYAILQIQMRITDYPSIGYAISGHLVVLLYLTVGWHYAKQTFGCMMVYAKLDGYKLAVWERNVLRYMLLNIWWVNWLYSNCSVGSYDFYGLTVWRLGLPDLFLQISITSLGILATTSVFIIIKKAIKDGQTPSINFLTPAIALFVWQVPVFANTQFFVLIALFHSLQYFPFVAKVESSRYAQKKESIPRIRLIVFYLFMIALGYMAFYYVPILLDQEFGTEYKMSVAFFMVAFMLFINIHHYFIDNVLWRFKNKEVREYLLT